MSDDLRETQRRSPSSTTGDQWAGLVSGLVHELRTPLASLGLVIDMLVKNSGADWEAKNARSLGHLKGLTDQLQTLIADTGRLAALAGDRVQVRARSVSLRDLLGRVEEASRGEGWKSGVTVSTSLGGDAPAELNTDPQLCEECLLGMFDIARALARNRVSALAVGDGDQVHIRIKSNGVAEMGDNPEAIFDNPFAGGLSRMLRERGGRPLAPLLSRELARSLGGDVTAMEDEEHSVWVLSLPVEF